MKGRKQNVDNTEQPKGQISHISLCYGYGGIDLGLHRVYGDRIRAIALCEIEAFACENALAKMEAGILHPAPIWNDLRTFPWADFRDEVDVLSGGFPCQPFSAAGKRNADSDPRHLFPAILEGIRICRPAFVFLENVEGIVSAKLKGDGWRDKEGTPVLLHVCRELERVGYRATWGIFSASEVGAPHQRKRVFILAHRRGVCAARPDPNRNDGERVCELSRRDSLRSEATGCGEVCGNVWPSRPGEPQHGWEPARTIVDDAGRVGSQNRKQQATGLEQSGENSRDIIAEELGRVVNSDSNNELSKRCNTEQRKKNPAIGMGATQWGKVKPSLDRNLDGPADGMDLSKLSGLGDSELAEIREWMERCDNRTDELRLLGNGVVPATAEIAWRTLYDELMEQSA